MKPHQAVVLSLSAIVLVLPASASAAACGGAGTAANGLGIANVRTANTSCRTGRDVARRYGRTTARRVRFRDRLGRAWTCRITEDATGTDEGYVARTKVRCLRGRAVVRLELRS